MSSSFGPPPFPVAPAILAATVCQRPSASSSASASASSVNSHSDVAPHFSRTATESSATARLREGTPRTIATTSTRLATSMLGGVSSCAFSPTGMSSGASAWIISIASSTVGSCPVNQAGVIAAATARIGAPPAPSMSRPSAFAPSVVRWTRFIQMSSMPSNSAPQRHASRDSMQHGYHIISSSSSAPNITRWRRARRATVAIISAVGIQSAESSPSHRSGPRSHPATSHAQRCDASAENHFCADRAVGWPSAGWMKPAAASMPTTSATTTSSAPTAAAKSLTATAPANSISEPPRKPPSSHVCISVVATDTAAVAASTCDSGSTTAGRCSSGCGRGIHCRPIFSASATGDSSDAL